MGIVIVYREGNHSQAVFIEGDASIIEMLQKFEEHYEPLPGNFEVIVVNGKITLGAGED
jgi:hypothetical protein